MAISDNETKLRYIMLTQMKGLGPVTQNAMLNICGSINKCFSVDYDTLAGSDAAKRIGVKRISSFILQRDDEGIRRRAEEILKKSFSLGISIVTREDDIFPVRFKNIDDMPVVLYTKGNLKINEFENSIGVVGARRCTREGKKKAIDITTEAVISGKAVISGMAKGIDSYAHTAALKTKGYTIAVLGNGVDICYPKEHFSLYETVAEHGCILSEYPPGTIPREYLFPKRNRIIAGLSDRLYVIDAGRNSGTQSTIKSSQKYSREVSV